MRRSGLRQVRLERVEREHLAPLDPGSIQPLEEVLVPRDAARAEVVEKKLHLDPTLGRLCHRGEDWVGRVVPGGDVELHQDVPLRTAHRVSHLRDRRLVMRQVLDTVAARHRHGPQGAVEVYRRREVLRTDQTDRHVRQVGGAGGDLAVCVRLLVPTLRPDRSATEEREGDQPDPRRQNDKHQPGEPRGRLTVPRHQPQRQHLDQDADARQDEQDQRGPRTGVHCSKPIPRTENGADMGTA